jgi:hypothetical protein
MGFLQKHFAEDQSRPKPSGVAAGQWKNDPQVHDSTRAMGFLQKHFAGDQSQPKPSGVAAEQ